MPTLRSLVLSSLIVCTAVSVEAAVHIWTGATSDRVSDAANWIGGSPQGDAAAELSFPAGAARLAVTNDVAGLTVQSIAFSAGGYVVTGQPITIAAGGTLFHAATGTNDIRSDLVLAGGATFDVTHDGSSDFDASGELLVSGSIGGVGPLVKIGRWTATFSGSRPNTYAGETRVLDGLLQLAKNDGVAAVPGNLVITSTGVNYENGHVTTLRNEQIPDSASVVVDHVSGFGVGGVETIGPLSIAGAATIQTAVDWSGEVHSAGRLILAGDLLLLSGSSTARVWGDISISGMRTIRGCAACANAKVSFSSLDEHTPGSGLIIRLPPGETPEAAGRGVEVRRGTYRGPTIIESGTASIENPNTAVRLIDGTFWGSVGSLVAEGGVIRAVAYFGGVKTVGDLRLSAATRVFFGFISEAPLTAGGTLDLGRATLVLQPDTNLQPVLGNTYVVGRNTGRGPIRNPFYGVPEGAVLENRFRVSYVGGDGNDLTMTEVGRYFTNLQVNVNPGVLHEGSDVTITARVTSFDRPQGTALTGRVTFRDGTTIVGTRDLGSDGTASLTYRPEWGVRRISVTYEGTDILAPVASTLSLQVSARIATVTSLEPARVTGGTTTQIVVRGSGFREGGVVLVSSTGYPTTFVSPEEVRFTYTAPRVEGDLTFQITYSQPLPSGLAGPGATFTVAANPPPRTLLTFVPLGVDAPVVRRGGAAWLAISRGGTTSIHTTRVTRDSDGDGIVRLPGPPQAFGTWLAVDLTDGRILSGSPAGYVIDPIPFPRGMFYRDANGVYGHVVVRTPGIWDLLWVRPGVGAWTFAASDSSGRDLDGAANGRALFHVSSMQPVDDSPAPPVDGLRAGDVFLGLQFDTRPWFGDRVDEHLAEGHGTGSVTFVPNSGGEKAGVVRINVFRLDGTDGEISVDYATADLSAIHGVHYAARAGRLTFGPGEIMQTIEIPLIDDAVYSGTTRFRLTLSNPAGTTISGSHFFDVAITDDEPAPQLTIENVTVDEGHEGTREVHLVARLTGATRVPVTARWTYGAFFNEIRTGTIFFLPGGPTTQTIVIPYEANRTPEEDRVINVTFRDVVDAQPRELQARVTIRDDDFATIHVLDATVSESQDSVRVTIAADLGGRKPVTVRYATRSGSATEGSDFSATSGTATFGQTQGRHLVTIPIVRDGSAEADESFTIVLSGATNAVIGRGTAQVMIVDDDAAAVLPALSASVPVVVERSRVSALVRFRLSLPAPRDVRFRVATVAGSATAPADFQPLDQTVTIAAGRNSASVAVPIVDDGQREAPETFSLVISEVTGAIVGTSTITATILDNDDTPTDPNMPTITVAGTSLPEGTGGTSFARFIVTLSRAGSAPFAVAYATADGSAAAVADYAPVSGTLTFAPGETSKTIDVAVVADRVHESEETFTLVVGTAVGTARIVDDDAAPVRRRP